jgi:hypothetical protein
MYQRNRLHWIQGAACAALSAGLMAYASASSWSASPIAVAVKHGDCAKAVDLANTGASTDNQVAYLAGRMLDEGICVEPDFAAAARFFARGAELGNRDALLEYAAKVGLGDGFTQSYDRAGEICRSAGVDPKARLSTYALGYACTLRGVAGRYLRINLPRGAFSPDSGLLRVEFNPGSNELSIRSTPHVARDEAPLGSTLGPLRVNAQQKTEEAWQYAVSSVPKPDAARLGNQPVELAIDVDLTLRPREELTGSRDLDHGISALKTNPNTPGLDLIRAH